MSAGWVGCDPGGAESGVVARAGDRLVTATVVVRDKTLPMGVYVREVNDVIRDALEALHAQAFALFEDNLAVEDLNPPNPHMGITSVRGLLLTAQVLGGILAVWPSAVVVPPGGHGSGPLAAYPAELQPTRGRGRGKDRLRHARSAWSIAGAAPLIQRLEGATTR